MSRWSKTKRPNDFFKVISLQLCSNAITIMLGDVSLYIGTCVCVSVCVCNLMVAWKSHKSWSFIISCAHVRPPTCLRKRPTVILFSIAAPSAAEGSAIHLLYYLLLLSWLYGDHVTTISIAPTTFPAPAQYLYIYYTIILFYTYTVVF